MPAEGASVIPPIVERLRDAAAAVQAERVSMGALAAAHGPEARGTLLMLLAMPCLLPVPGVGFVLGTGLVALAAAMWRGHSVDCLPQRVAELELPARWAQRVLLGLASAYSIAARHSRARLSHLAEAGRRSLTALSVGVMAVIVVMPIPFGNVLPALAVTLIGLGLVFRDGLAVILGHVVAGLALVITTGLILLASLLGSDLLSGWGFG